MNAQCCLTWHRKQGKSIVNHLQDMTMARLMSHVTHLHQSQLHQSQLHQSQLHKVGAIALMHHTLAPLSSGWPSDQLEPIHLSPHLHLGLQTDD